MADEKVDESGLSLDEMLTGGLVRGPAKLIVYGREGIGKTKWASLAPRPIVISAERGTDQMRNVMRKEVQSWDEFRSVVMSVARRKHGYKTLVIDGMTALESMLWRWLCANNRPPCESIEEVGDGFGKGFTKAQERWAALTVTLDKVIVEGRGMNVVFVGHSEASVFKNPEGQDYNRYRIAMNVKAAEVLRRWAHSVLFMGTNARIIGGLDPENEKLRPERPGKQLGALKRTLVVVPGEGKEAKNRYDLDNVIPAEEMGDPKTGKGSDAEKFWQSLREYLPEGMVG